MPQAIVVPNSDPIAAVAAIAIAPQKVTRKIALPIGAPPAFAPTPPRMARNKSAAIDTVQLSVAAGDKGTIANGSAAPYGLQIASGIGYGPVWQSTATDFGGASGLRASIEARE